MLHPRMPPVLRPLPHVEALSLFPTEESNDEIALRQALGLGIQHKSLNANDGPDESHQQSSPTAGADHPNQNDVLMQSPCDAPPSLPTLPDRVPSPTPQQQTATTVSSSILDSIEVAFNSPSNLPTQPEPAPLVMAGPQPPKSPSPRVHQRVPGPSSSNLVIVNNDDDEPMPEINMDSDTDDE